MAAEPAYLGFLMDIQTTVRELTIAARRAYAEPDPTVPATLIFRGFEDQLFVTGTALAVLRDDLIEAGSRVATLEKKLEEDIRACQALIDRVRRHEDALRIPDAVRAKYDPAQITIDDNASVTVVRGAPRRPLPAGTNVVLFPGTGTGPQPPIGGGAA